MKAEFKRDMNHNYMILTGEEVDTGSYQIRMLVGNVVPSLLKCRVQALDGEFRFYYDITSRQSVFALFDKGKFGSGDLRMLLEGFLQVMDEMGEYLMNACHLILKPEYIYLDMEKRRVSFCCFPGYDKEVREQFQQLTEYILPRLNHQDPRAVIVGYGVYRKALEDDFHLEHIKEEVYREEEVAVDTEAPSQTDQTPFWQQNTGEENGTDTGSEEIPLFREENSLEEKEKLQSGMAVQLAACTFCGLILGGILIAKAMGYLPWIGMEVILGLALALLGVGLLTEYLAKKQQEARTAGKKRAEKRKELIQDDREAVYRKKEQECLKKRTCEEKQEFLEGKRDKEESQRNEGKREGRRNCGHREKWESPVTAEENYGETVVLSEGAASGPAALVSREAGELATIYLQEEITVVGKLSAAADAVIDLPTVSRIHAKIRKVEEEYYLTDLNSRNGTVVNGRILKSGEEYCLQNEDEVDFAQARYIFLR